METHKAETRVLSESAGDVHRLHAITGCALHEVVDRGEHDYAATARIRDEADVGEVRPGHQLRLGIPVDPGALLHDPHERLRGVGLTVQAPQGLVVERGLRIHVRRREHAAYELHRRHREIHAWHRTAQRQLLLDLRRMAVTDGPERAHDPDPLWMMAVRAWLASALARSDLALHHDRSRAIDDVRAKEGQEPEDGRRRVAARAGDACGVLYPRSVELGYAIDELTKPL